MNIREAMAAYFKKLNRLYADLFGTLPTASWGGDGDTDLFIGPPDEDGEAPWHLAPALPLTESEVSGLCPALRDFYGSFYFRQMRGKLRGLTVSFPAQKNRTAAIRAAETALSDGKYYFPSEDIACLATCSLSGNDDLLLFYRQTDDSLFLYDADTKEVLNLAYPLERLLEGMEAII